MFEYPLKIFKLLAKLKIIIDLNFQIFKTIEVNLRKNTNFLNRSTFGSRQNGRIPAVP